MGARILETIIDFQHGKHIHHNAIHKVLLDHGLANVNRNKAKRRKPWVRYEREHSLSRVGRDFQPLAEGEEKRLLDLFRPHARRLAYYRGAI
ncbi:MAG: hypothetical protein WAW52_14350 [Methanothrix sp.]